MKVKVDVSYSLRVYDRCVVDLLAGLVRLVGCMVFVLVCFVDLFAAGLFFIIGYVIVSLHPSLHMTEALSPSGMSQKTHWRDVDAH